MYGMMYNWDDLLGEADAVLTECDRFFVYGSLKSSSYNNTILRMGTLLDDAAVTQDKFALGDIGFPYAFPDRIVPVEYEHLLFPVRGELWQVKDPATALDLDFLEGYPDHYDREVTTLVNGDRAWMYVQKDWGQAQRCDACHLEEGVWEWRR